MNILDCVNLKIENKQKVKLHLGCGSVLLLDYINVDGEWMNHVKDIAIHDLTKPFPLPDNCVDEILTVHVIEHISRSKVSSMMKEWHRILKPGGTVAVEWPDAYKACREIAKNPDIMFSTDRRELKRTMFVFWADDDRYDDISMAHKWGYSEKSLGNLFIQHGFREWKSEYNQYAKTKNDSRIVVYK